MKLPKAFLPTSAGAIIVFTLFTAFLTPFPSYLFLSPSLNSNASQIPVDAPEGTAALNKPSSVTTSASIVGKPLESRISLADIDLIVENLLNYL